MQIFTVEDHHSKTADFFIWPIVVCHQCTPRDLLLVQETSIFFLFIDQIEILLFAKLFLEKNQV